jgi:hypothetical protein
MTAAAANADEYVRQWCIRCGRPPATIPASYPVLCKTCYGRAVQGLSSQARKLLVRAAAERFGMVLEHSEVPVAVGLQKRKLAKLERPRKFLSNRPEPGSVPRLVVNGAGEHYVDSLPPEQRARDLAEPKPAPVTLEECIRIARELARGVVDPKTDPRWLENRARAALARLAGLEGPEE